MNIESSTPDDCLLFSKKLQSKFTSCWGRAYGAVTRTYDFTTALASYYLPGYTNELELRVIAPRRSGHHAIINWLLDQCSGRYMFLNNCYPSGNPFEMCVKAQSFVGTKYYRMANPELGYESANHHSKKGLLIYNFEDYPIEVVNSVKFNENRIRWLGSSRRFCDVIILRDAFNLFASKYRWYKGSTLTPSRDELYMMRSLWIEYAEEALRYTSLLSDPLIIKYNDWFTSSVYRDELRTKLGMRGGDKSLERVAQFGPTTWGDSFDGLKFDGNATEMPVFDRWKMFEEDEEFIDLLANQRLLELNKTLFPDMPGDTDFLERVTNKAGAKG